ncbi:hypothetical protein QJ48_24325 [Paenibacillus sp. A3]|nr:hypothetical protein QJ48_24325 [Paenibacillus sp. A3]
MEGTLDKSAVRAYLKESLPDYMVPSYLKPLDSLPLTTNGKVDVRALPEISPDELAEGAYEAPRTRTEAKLAEIWQDVLGVSSIGIDDHFFEVGGNSLSLIKLLSNIKSVFGVALELNSLYKHPTIRLAAQYIVTEEYRRASEEDGIYLLNEEKEAHIFAFPPIAGLGIVYSELAQAIGSHSLYAFDFIESDDRIDRYVSLMTSKQQEGPYVLFGYSAGGNLAFEVAAELTRRGLEVSDLILLDSYKFDSAVVRIQSADTANVYQDILEEADARPFYRKLFETDDFKDKVKHKIEMYSHYLNGLANDEVIGANIHFIEADKAGEAPKAENPAIVPIVDWSDYTTKRYTRYQGFGKHGEMLAPDYLLSNAAVLTNILQQTRKITVF